MWRRLCWTALSLPCVAGLLAQRPILTSPGHHLASLPSLASGRGRIPLLRQDSSGGNGWAEHQRQDLQQVLDRIDGLTQEIQQMNITSTDDELLKDKQMILESLENKANQLLTNSVPPEGLSMEAYKAAIRCFFNLPAPHRLAFVRALEMEDTAAADPQKIPAIVSELYKKQYTLTRTKLTTALKESKSTMSTEQDKSSTTNGKQEEEIETLFRDLFDGESLEERQVERNAKAYLPRVALQEDRAPSEKDVQVLTNALENSVFTSTSRPISIPGGYVIRGQNRKESGEALISAIDAKLPKDWDCTVSWMLDFSDEMSMEDKLFEECNALVLFKKDFSPVTTEWLYRIISLISFGTIMLFSVGVYGSNDEVLKRLTDATSINDFAVLDWFNGKVAQVLVPLLLILASHEAGHFFISKKEKIETTSLLPTFIPIFGSLPLLGTLTRIKSSPRNYSSLYDFALMGPLLGFVTSFVFLAAGLIATKATLDGDAAVAQLLPALPVSVISLSTLGSSLIDNFFAGGDGYISGADPASPVALHPFAIAGYCGLLINAAEMLPLGATDGGRMSMAIFGRRGHTFVGALTWFALLVATFTLEDRQASLLLSAWASGNIFQNDMEVPCRDESDNPNILRMTTAFILWFLAALIIIPR